MFIRAYLRASTSEQDASRARNALDTFAIGHGPRIAARYVENENGAKLGRPELSPSDLVQIGGGPYRSQGISGRQYITYRSAQEPDA